eukprot:349637-Chlamydomonas_euryale.AAC.4
MYVYDGKPTEGARCVTTHTKGGRRAVALCSSPQEAIFCMRGNVTGLLSGDACTDPAFLARVPAKP